jgi:acetylglutamate kinase
MSRAKPKAATPGATRLPVSIYKVGGPALEDRELLGPLADDVRRVAGYVALVHGGGRHIERLLSALAIPSRFVEGRRETSPEAMDVVEMVLSGGTNKALAGGLLAAGLPAVGISGRDAGLLRARPVAALGRVGSDVSVQPELILALWRESFVPVISPVSCGPAGEALNVNADEAALGVAAALFAQRLIYLSDVDGVRVGDDVMETLSQADAEALIAAGTIAGGMALKVRMALDAAQRGVAEVVIAGKARLLGGFPGTRMLARPGAQPLAAGSREGRT